MADLVFENFDRIILGFMVFFFSTQFLIFSVVRSNFSEIKKSNETVKANVINVFTINKKTRMLYEYMDFRGKKHQLRTGVSGLNDVAAGDNIDVIYATNKPQISMPKVQLNS